MGLRLVVLAVSTLVSYTAFAADLSGIWMGQAPGRNTEKQDIAFQFKTVKGVLSGVMFGDEFDLPLEDLKINGDLVTFSVTTTNYYSGSRLTTTYSGTVSSNELQLTRQRKDQPVKAESDDKMNEKQVITLKRVVAQVRDTER